MVEGGQGVHDSFSTNHSFDLQLHQGEMSHHKSYCVGSIPFSWENQPGISKVTPQAEENHLKLPPPPCKSDSPMSAAHGLHVPLPPCIFQPPSRSSSKKGLKEEDDPFFAAYMECTRNVRTQGRRGSRRRRKRDGLIGLFSCTGSSGVREKAIVRLSQLPEVRE
ncbi:unnamed protein product [Musa hybrid cultivar]